MFIKTSDHSLPEPTRATIMSAGYDLRSNESFRLHAGERYTCGTGYSLQIQLGTKFTALVCPRSGLAADKGITVLNGPGIIDADYDKELKVILYNSSKVPVDINEGDRIAQLMFTAYGILPDETTPTTKRTDGFGSTGG